MAFIATVTWSVGGATEPPGNWYVEFTGTGDGGWSSGPMPTDEGEATYTRSSPRAQTETVTARVVNDECSDLASDPVTHEWWSGEIVITSPSTSTSINTDVTLTGQVLRNGLAVGGAMVSGSVFDLEADNPQVPLKATTEADGTFAVAWRSSVPAIESVSLNAIGDGGFTASTVTSHSWSEAAPRRRVDAFKCQPARGCARHHHRKAFRRQRLRR